MSRNKREGWYAGRGRYKLDKKPSGFIDGDIPYFDLNYTAGGHWRTKTKQNSLRYNVWRF